MSIWHLLMVLSLLFSLCAFVLSILAVQPWTKRHAEGERIPLDAADHTWPAVKLKSCNDEHEGMTCISLEGHPFPHRDSQGNQWEHGEEVANQTTVAGSSYNPEDEFPPDDPEPDYTGPSPKLSVDDQRPRRKMPNTYGDPFLSPEQTTDGGREM